MSETKTYTVKIDVPAEFDGRHTELLASVLGNIAELLQNDSAEFNRDLVVRRHYPAYIADLVMYEDGSIAENVPMPEYIAHVVVLLRNDDVAAVPDHCPSP